jgi:uncharacterized membrane protein (DUF2068 family)
VRGNSHTSNVSGPTIQAGERLNSPGLKRSSSAGTSAVLRAVAAFEAAKGGLALLLGCGVLHLIHHNVDDIAERLTEVLHVNPDGRLSNLFVELASHVTDRVLWVLAIGVLVYAAVRAIEAYGLWREREWAVWFELLSTALYLPPELYWLQRHPSWLKLGVLFTNILILLFMLILRVKAVRSRRAPPGPGERVLPKSAALKDSPQGPLR